MFIREITAIDRRKSRVLTDGDLAFVLYKADIIRLGLREGMELSEEFYTKNIDSILYLRARQKLVNLLADMDRSSAQLVSLLKKAGYPEQIISRSIDYCKSRRYIDDERYASSYIERKSDKKSAYIIRNELAGKGIDADIIDRLMEDACIDETAQIEKELKRRGYPGKYPDRESLSRLFAALCRRGYSYESIRSAMRNTDFDDI